VNCWFTGDTAGARRSCRTAQAWPRATADPPRARPGEASDGDEAIRWLSVGLLNPRANTASRSLRKPSCNSLRNSRLTRGLHCRPLARI
jgi:hypothetical protein